MKKVFKFLLEGVFWILEPTNSILFLLMPAGLIGVGVMIEAGWMYYPIALGIYALVMWALSWLADLLAAAIFNFVKDWWKKRKK